MLRRRCAAITDDGRCHEVLPRDDNSDRNNEPRPERRRPDTARLQAASVTPLRHSPLLNKRGGQSPFTMGNDANRLPTVGGRSATSFAAQLNCYDKHRDAIGRRLPDLAEGIRRGATR